MIQGFPSHGALGGPPKAGGRTYRLNITTSISSRFRQGRRVFILPVDLTQLLTDIAVPRPNGSAALGLVRDRLAEALGNAGVAVVQEPFIVRPYMQALTGLALFALAVGVLLAFRNRRFWIALLLAVLIPAVYFLEFEWGYPVVSWIGQRPACNLVVEQLAPGGSPTAGGSGDQAAGEAAASRPLVILSAHYDSKTEVFDHRARQPIYSAAPAGMLLLILVAALGLVASRLGWLRFLDHGFGRGTLFTLGCLGAAVIALLFYSFAGGYLVSRPSPGARDDGASCVVLAAVAADLPELGLRATDVRVVLFAGEEVNCLGSAAYVAAHPELRSRPVYVINLEVVGGGGELGYATSGGKTLRKYATSGEIRAFVDQALEGEGVSPLAATPFIIDDSGSFLAAGVKALTLIQEIPGQPSSYHNAGDDVSKVAPGEMERIVGALEATLKVIDDTALAGAGK